MRHDDGRQAAYGRNTQAIDAWLREAATPARVLPNPRPADPSWCPRCAAVFTAGRWRWQARPASAETLTCPACTRELEHEPGGYLTIEGEFFLRHRRHVLALIDLCALRAAERFPLERLMGIEAVGDGLRVTTTHMYLARRLADALHEVYGGELAMHFQPDARVIRAHWRR